MIVKNESELLEKAINTAKPFVNEIIVVDTGSTDQTPEIARKLGAIVANREWNGSFSDARNFSLDLASQPFIFVMDADEIIVNGSLSAIQERYKYIQEHKGSAGSVTIVSETVSGDISSSSVTRLFPRDRRYRYTGKIHEQLTYSGNLIDRVIDTGIILSHSGYSAQVISKKNKYERNLQLLLSELSTDSDTSYNLFQIGRTYYVMKDYVQAEHFLYRSIEAELRSMRRNFLSSALLTLGYCNIKLQKFDELKNIFNLGIELFPDFTDLYFMYGVGLIESKNINSFELIPDVFEKCINIGEAPTFKYETVKGVGSFKAHFNLGLYYELTRQLDKAEFHYRLSYKDSYQPAFERLQKILH